MKNKKHSYDEKRKEYLFEDNLHEDRVIKHLEKTLRIRKRPIKNSSKSAHPLWMRQYGLDYLLTFDEDTKSSECNAQMPPAVEVITKKMRKKPAKDIYGQVNLQEKPDHNSTNQTMSRITEKPLSGEDDLCIAQEATDKAFNTLVNSKACDLHRPIRSCLNRLSEAHMPHILSELTSLFTKHPRASVRSAMIDEVLALLASTPVSSRSNTGWLQQQLAVCLSCTHVSMQMQLQHDHIIGYVVEAVIRAMDSSDNSDASLASMFVFIAYLFRFGVLSSVLIFDLLQEMIISSDLYRAKASHFVCIAVGVHLRKANLASCQEITRLATNQLVSCSPQQFDLSCELEGTIRHLSTKHSKEECVRAALHLRKMMQVWTKVPSLSDEFCLVVSLQDVRHVGTRGRPWLVGSAALQLTSSTENNAKSSSVLGVHQKLESPPLSPELAAAASRLGLRTPARQHIFGLLVSTPGGPDSTASVLLKACSSTHGNATGTSQEREVVQLVLHCAMAEQPFNRFYPRVLGSLLNHNRRFVMMVKCAFWDTLKKEALSVDAKANAGRTLGLLVLVFDFPLTVLKNFDFGDPSDGNVAFVKHVLIELVTGDYTKVLSKVMQLSSYTRLGRNIRIFMRKHFDCELDEGRKTYILRLVKDMRDSETF